MRNFTASDNLFIDTWGWLVLANEKDPDYSQVLGLRVQYAERSQPWITTDYVLDETLTRLFAATPFPKAQRFCEAIFESEKLGAVIIEKIDPERFEKAWKLRLRYRDKPRISFTDLTSFVVMQELGIKLALTGDTHFNQV